MISCKMSIMRASYKLTQDLKKNDKSSLVSVIIEVDQLIFDKALALKEESL